MTFQAMAPTRAPKITGASRMPTSMMPLPMVLATCRPNTMKATKLKNAAQKTATTGESTRVETTVAIEFAASCRPFRKSNSSATAISATRTQVATMSGSDVLDDDAGDDVGHVLAAIDHRFD